MEDLVIPGEFIEQLRTAIRDREFWMTAVLTRGPATELGSKHQMAELLKAIHNFEVAHAVILALVDRAASQPEASRSDNDDVPAWISEQLLDDNDLRS